MQDFYYNSLKVTKSELPIILKNYVRIKNGKKILDFKRIALNDDYCLGHVFKDENYEYWFGFDLDIRENAIGFFTLQKPPIDEFLILAKRHKDIDFRFDYYNPKSMSDTGKITSVWKDNRIFFDAQWSEKSSPIWNF